MPTDLYHKIQSVYLRDPATKHRTFLDGEFSVDAFEYLAESDWVWTEKVDGTNIRVIWDGDAVSFGGRTERAEIQAPLLEHLTHTYTPEQLRGVFGDDPALLYGEGCGPKIRKGGGYGSTQRFVLFDVRCGGVWLERDNVIDIAGQMAIPVVPVVGGGTIAEAIAWVRGRPRSTWGDFVAEGLVLRPRVELLTRRGDRVITKIKVKDFPEGTS